MEVTESFSSFIMGPFDAGFIIIVDVEGRGKKMGEMEIMENVGNMLERFDTFISGINFRFCGATSGDALTFGYPVEWAPHPDDETGY